MITYSIYSTLSLALGRREIAAKASLDMRKEEGHGDLGQKFTT